MLKKFEALNFEGTGSHVDPIRRPKRRGDVGHDLCAAEDVRLEFGMNWVPTGVAVDARFPLWYIITGRSSLHKRGLFCPLGVIDAGYQGELFVPLVSLYQTHQILITAGEYIAQIIFFDAVVQPELRPVTEFEKSERGQHGFGSTDR